MTEPVLYLLKEPAGLTRFPATVLSGIPGRGGTDDGGDESPAPEPDTDDGGDEHPNPGDDEDEDGDFEEYTDEGGDDEDDTDDGGDADADDI